MALRVSWLPIVRGPGCRIGIGVVLRVVAVLVMLTAIVPVDAIAADRPPGLFSNMPTVADLGRTQTLQVDSEGSLSWDVMAERLNGMGDAAGHLADWGWIGGYERTFVSGDALWDDAHLVQITLHQFSSPPGEDVVRYLASAREQWTRVREQAPHANHPDWLKLAGPSDTGNEVTYYAVAGAILARVITVAEGDPAADATDIMGRVLRKARGEKPAKPAPAKPAPAKPAPAKPAPADSNMAGEVFEQVDRFWAGMGYDWYVSPRMDLFTAPDMTGCGYLAVDPGPFYCVLDGTIYLDEPVLEMLSEQQADFLLGLFVAHEWGHHIQRLAGYDSAAIPIFDGQVWSLQAELAADCLAGVWANGELLGGRASPDELMMAVKVMIALGDEAGSPLSAPDAHGSGEMRAGAFLIGLKSGDPGACEDRILHLP